MFPQAGLVCKQYASDSSNISLFFSHCIAFSFVCTIRVRRLHIGEQSQMHEAMHGIVLRGFHRIGWYLMNIALACMNEMILHGFYHNEHRIG